MKKMTNEKLMLDTISIDKGKPLTEYVALCKLTTWEAIQQAFKRAVPRLYFILAL